MTDRGNGRGLGGVEANPVFWVGLRLNLKPILHRNFRPIAVVAVYRSYHPARGTRCRPKEAVWDRVCILPPACIASGYRDGWLAWLSPPHRVGESGDRIYVHRHIKHVRTGGGSGSPYWPFHTIPALAV